MFKNVKGGAILAEFGEVLAQLRQKRHISQAELGRAIFVSGGTISNYEKGVHFPDVEKLLLCITIRLQFLMMDTALSICRNKHILINRLANTKQIVPRG